MRWVYRQTSQEVCPWNVWFAQELKEPAFKPREVLAGKDARQLVRDLLAMTPEKFSAAFKNSPMKRAELRGLKRNAAVVLGNSPTASLAESAMVAEVLMQSLLDPEPLVRKHAAWAMERLTTNRRSGTAHDARDAEPQVEPGGRR